MKKKKELATQIDNLIGELEISRTKEVQKKIEEGLVTIQESLDYLRICIKYMVFDLEATRRENEHLRNLIAEGGEV